MESSNNNLNPLDQDVETVEKTIDRLEMVVNHLSDCVNPTYPAQDPTYPAQDPTYPAQDPAYPAQDPAYPAQDPAYPAQDPTQEQDDGNDNYFIDDRNQSFSETRLATDKRHSSIRKDKSLFENTFRMEPKPDQYFIGYKAKALMASVVGPLFSNFVYESKAAATLCRLICNKVILVLKKKTDWPRYRYVCNATIVQTKKQGLVIAERCLWNTALDGSAVCTIESKSAVLVVTLHGIYFE